jgi:hypothetical protein
MTLTSTLELAKLPDNTADGSHARSAPWLQSPYPDSVWIVADTWDASRTATIDFNFMLADGRALPQVERLYATIKEYAFFVRDDRFAAIDDAKTHVVMVRGLMYIAHALTLRKIFSFSHVQPFDLKEIIEECRFGADSVAHASERVDKYLSTLAATNIGPPPEGSGHKPFGGLPRQTNQSKGQINVVSSSAIVSACNLPSAATFFPGVATLISKAAKANGLNSNNNNYDSDDIRPAKNVTVQAMQRWLAPIEQLYTMRRQIEAESIDFKPFPQGAGKVASVKGVGTERTPTPPPSLALHLLEQSARKLFDQKIDEIGTMGRIPILRLATACWIIIAAFTARRDEEVDDLRIGCIRGDDTNGYWLHVYIEKTLQRKEWIPVPSLVARAVTTLTVISESARAKSGSDQLFQWLDLDGEIHRIDVGRYLDDFAAEVNVPLHCVKGKAPSAWHWHPHQFRRFFAILYFYRYEGANIETLSYFLRHFSLEMTKRYVTQDPEAAALWTDVEWGYMGHVARTIVAGERSISGSAGERLKKLSLRLIDLFRRKLYITSPDRIGASLTLLMQRHGMVLTPKPWVTCSCPKTAEAASKAACRKQTTSERNAVGPDFAHAGPTVCSNCPHAITEGARSGVLDREVDHLETAASCAARTNTIFGELEAARVLELREVRDSRYASAKPMPGSSAT